MTLIRRIVGLLIVLVSLVLIKPDLFKFLYPLVAGSACRNETGCQKLYAYFYNHQDTHGVSAVGRVGCARGFLSICISNAKVRERLESWAEADVLFALACEHGDTQACVERLVMIINHGDAGKVIPEGTRLCRKGDGFSCYVLGKAASKVNNKSLALWAFYDGCYRRRISENCVLYGNVNIDAQPAVARNAWESGCALGDNYACTNLKRYFPQVAVPGLNMNLWIAEVRKARESFRGLVVRIQAKPENVSGLTDLLRSHRERLLVLSRQGHVLGAGISPAFQPLLVPGLREVNAYIEISEGLTAMFREGQDHVAAVFQKIDESELAKNEFERAVVRSPASTGAVPVSGLVRSHGQAH